MYVGTFYLGRHYNCLLNNSEIMTVNSCILRAVEINATERLNVFFAFQCKGKGKVVPDHTMMAYGGGGV